MSDLRPIVQDDPTERERMLLGSARLDSPPAGSRQGVLAALGLAAVTTTAGAGATATATATSAALVVKWLATGAVGGAIVLGAVLAARPSARPGAMHPAAGAGDTRPVDEPSSGAVGGAMQEPPASAASPALLPTVGDVRREPPAMAAPAPTSVRSARAAPVPTPSPSASAPAPAPEPEPAGAAVAGSMPQQARLAAEVVALEEARHALASGETATALRALDAYDRRFAPPILGPEATVLRIEALIAAGRVDVARRLAGEMLAAQPDSPYAKRVRSLLAAAPSNAP